MTHVQIVTLDTGALSLRVDGVEMAMKVAAKGFGVEFPEDSDQPVSVRMTVLADTVDLDLAHAEVSI